mmetsp:Transcript_11140/g.18923  ORF Transcript_11140/g.18923 Transcript_11140/m.18923 type:complete len:260 (-) Transcript_11140:1067-1846(-)
MCLCLSMFFLTAYKCDDMMRCDKSKLATATPIAGQQRHRSIPPREYEMGACVRKNKKKGASTTAAVIAATPVARRFFLMVREGGGESGHGALLAVGDEDQLQAASRVACVERRVHAKEPAANELHDVPRFELLQRGLHEHGHGAFGGAAQEVLHLVVLLHFRFGDEVVELYDRSLAHILVLGHPVELLLHLGRGLHLRFAHSCKARHAARAFIFDHRRHLHHTPPEEDDVVASFARVGIFRLEQHLVAEAHGAGLSWYC